MRAGTLTSRRLTDVRNALGGVRICDFSGQLAGAGATRFLAAMGAEVIRVEDPVTEGYWDALRGVPPFVDERRGTDFGGPFNNHNVEKLGVTLNLAHGGGQGSPARAHRCLRRLHGEFRRRGHGTARLLLRGGCGRSAATSCTCPTPASARSGPYRDFKTWGPLAQASCGSPLPPGSPDNTLPASATRTWIITAPMSWPLPSWPGFCIGTAQARGSGSTSPCTDAGALLTVPALLDYTVNKRPMRAARAHPTAIAAGPA